MTWAILILPLLIPLVASWAWVWAYGCLYLLPNTAISIKLLDFLPAGFDVRNAYYLSPYRKFLKI